MTDRKIVLGIDLDEVVFSYCEGLRKKMMNAGFTVPEGEPISYSMAEAKWFPSNEDFCKFHGELVDEGLYESLELIEDASEVLWDLSNSGYQNNIITSRFVNPGQHKKVVSQTVAALDHHDIPYSNLSFLDNKVLQFADAYIDDSPKNINHLSAADRFVIRKKMLYNEGCPGVPVSSWKEIREVLREKFGR